MVLKWLAKRKELKAQKKRIEEIESVLEDTITPLIEVKGIGALTVAKFESQGITTVEGLLTASSEFLWDAYDGIFTHPQLKKFQALVKAH